jgi:hypothetical protein
LRTDEDTQNGNPERNGELGENRSETGGGIGLTPVDGERKEVDQSSLNLMPKEETQMENSESNGEFGGNRAETDDEIELPYTNDGRKVLEELKDGGNYKGCSVSSVPMDFASAVTQNSGDCREDLSQSHMGIVQMQDLEGSNMNEVIGSDSTSQILNNSPGSLTRSVSYGGRLFLPRNGRNLSSILPF